MLSKRVCKSCRNRCQESPHAWGEHEHFEQEQTNCRALVTDDELWDTYSQVWCPAEMKSARPVITSYGKVLPRLLSRRTDMRPPRGCNYAFEHFIEWVAEKEADGGISNQAQ